MTPAEIFLEMLKPDGRPERQLVQYEALGFVMNEPVLAYLRGNRVRGTTSVDRWGTTILFPADAPGPMPHITEENKVCPDITRWRDYVHAPNVTSECSGADWAPARARAEEVRAQGKLATCFMGTGMFEQCHFLMGFEDTLTNLYEHPDEMHQLIEYILEYRLAHVKLLIENIHPDVLFTHDDWGTKDALFMQPEVWREFYKEPYRKFYGYIRSQGIIAIHHADSYLAPIVEDMAEIGIQCWQGVLPENDIPALQERLQGKMILMGGVGAAIDRADAEPEEIAAYVRRTLEENCPGGHYIPSITYGLAGTVFPHVDPIIDREIIAYNSVLHLPSYRTAHPVRRAIKQAAAQKKATAGETGSDQPLMEKLATALQKGKKKQTLALCQQALDDGMDARDILTNGLLIGMTRVGEDFSANRVFVPEMLLAARCMQAATELLRCHLTGEKSAAGGRVVLGTVKGDMHDIGKNLVKIMMEGSGLEVIDLGVDVSAEQFVNTAFAENCGLIACSSLLTTTMPEMRRVVELAREKGIRDKIKIMVGGAPISQSFCDEIGADLYTEDAAAAARVAARVLACG